jgi:hypothetical protein
VIGVITMETLLYHGMVKTLSIETETKNANERENEKEKRNERETEVENASRATSFEIKREIESQVPLV